MWKRVLLGAVVLLFLGLAYVVYQIGPRNVIGVLTYGRQAREGSLRVGDAAPVVSLVALDGSTRVGLDTLIGARPLVLVFGSFT